MKKILKETMLLVIMLAVLFQSSIVYGADAIINANSYNPDRYNMGSTDQLEEKAGTIVAVIRNVGIIVAIISLMVIGLKTMVASAEQKSVYKEALPGYLFGVFMVVAITAIPSIIYNFMQE